MTDEEMVRLHRDVLREVRAQPLALRRKIRLVRKAKAYIREHEGALDEKLAHGGGTMKDHMIRVKLLIARVYATRITNRRNLSNTYIAVQHIV